jgi:hypothetical protein
MEQTIWISCPRTADSTELLRFAARQNWLQVAGIGACGIGTDPISGEAVFCGASKPMLHEHWLDGSQGVCIEGAPALGGLIHAAAQYAGRLTVLTTGPLTDVALALSANPSLAQQISHC